MEETGKLASWLMAADAGRGRDRSGLQHALVDLQQGRPERARRAALAALADDPRSKPALGLWVDAADAMGLDEEVGEALGTLTRLLPERADLWWRRSQAGPRLAAQARHWAERAVRVAEPRVAALSAARWLFRDALDHHDVERAERFAQHLRFGFEVLENTHFDLAELDLAHGRVEVARRRLAAEPGPALLDGRGWLTVARCSRDDDEAQRPLERALLLGNPAVARQAGALACLRASLGKRVLPLAQALEVADGPEWTLAAALAGCGVDQRPAVCARQATTTPVASIALIWLQIALESRRPDALAQANDWARSLPELARHPLEVEASLLLEARAHTRPEQRLLALDAALYFARDWARDERQQIYGLWIGQARWQSLLDELARQLPSDAEPLVADTRRRIEATQRGPLAAVLVGEFNAGKSSLVNALTGKSTAAVGVTPTTSSWARYDWDGLRLIDTPGFNAPGVGDGQAPAAALSQAHLVLWVVDGSLPFRDSEARRLAAIQADGLPFWVVVNKRDRVPEEELEGLLTHVQTGLSMANLRPIGPTLAVAAQQPATLRPLSEQLAAWMHANGERLRTMACLRLIRRLLAVQAIPSSTEQPSGSTPRRSLDRAGRGSARLEALLRALDHAENNLKR